MTSLSDDPDSWTEEALRGLVHRRAAETVRLDFKLELGLTNRPARRELAKDLSAFANTEGGFIVVGIDEADGIACATRPAALQPGLAEAIDEVNQSWLAPPISSLRHAAVRCDDGTAFYVVHIPRSEIAPHQVCADGDFRYYRRHERSCRPMSDSEIAVVVERRIRATTDRVQSAREHVSSIVEWHTVPEVIVAAVPLWPTFAVDLRDVPAEPPVDSIILNRWWAHRTPSRHGMTGVEDPRQDPSSGSWFVDRRGGVVLRKPLRAGGTLVMADLVGLARDCALLALYFIRAHAGDGSLLISVGVRGEANGLQLRVDTMDRHDGRGYEVGDLCWSYLVSASDVKRDKWRALLVRYVYECAGRMQCDLVANNDSLAGDFADEVRRRCGSAKWSDSARTALRSE